MSENDDSLIESGARLLRDALDRGQVTLPEIQREYDRDHGVLVARRWLGNKNDNQALITRGIAIRQAARAQVLEAPPCKCSATLQVIK